MEESAVSFVLSEIRDLVVAEGKLLSGVGEEVEELEKQLKEMACFLEDADKKRHQNKSISNWLIEMRDLTHRAQDAIEEHAARVLYSRRRRGFRQVVSKYACIMKDCSSLHQLATDISKIKSDLEKLTNKLQESGVTRSVMKEDRAESSSAALENLSRQSYPNFLVGDCFVGMEDEMKMLEDFLVNEDDKEQRVISVWGMGGLGKTTIAKKVYNNIMARNERCFDRFAWVCISQKCVIRSVLANILGQLKNGASDVTTNLDEASLIMKLCEVQKDKRCLIVVDDLWELSHWNRLKNAFLVQHLQTKVLITTRNQHVAEIGFPVKLGLLNKDDALDLLMHKAFFNKKLSVETGSKSLKDIGREIVVKCGRLPLSISVIGGILRQKEQNIGEWEMVSLNMDSYLMHGEGVTENKGVTHVLSLSYDTLPCYLKPCFLYLACFPEDAQIQTEKLYLLWMAEGFISSRDKGRNESLRDVAEGYLTELAMRCMVQVHKNENWFTLEKFDSCGLHDLMRDLCSAKAKEVVLTKRIELSKYENGIPSSMNKITIPSSVIDYVRRVAIIVDSTAKTPSVDGLKEVKSLRSFMISGKEIYGSKKIRFTDCTIDFERSLCLRILVLENCEFEDEKLPSKVSKLIHLRYLSLFRSKVKELPEFVCNMSYLHTLDLRVSDLRVSGRLRLPNVIMKMKRLRHLFLLYKIEVTEGDKLRLDGLVELETLDRISSESACIVDILEMVNLRKLVVRVKDMDSLLTVVNHLTNNKSCQHTELIVVLCDIGKDIFMDMLMSPSLVRLSIENCNVSGGFPLYKAGMCQNLLSLSVIDCKVGGDMKMIEELGKYPKLQSLYIRGVEIMGETETLICHSNSFPQLKNLLLSAFPNLKKWQVEERALPKLICLLICNCVNLEKLPDGLRFISTLQQLHIYSMPEEFTDRVRGEDNANISHIPSINIVG